MKQKKYRRARKRKPFNSPRMGPELEMYLAKRWVKQMEGTLRFLEELETVANIHGETWKKNMGRYYRNKLALLLEAAPPGASQLFPEIQKRILKLPDAE